jgi:hypothetical protein
VVDPAILELIFASCCNGEMQKCSATETYESQLYCADSAGMACVLYIERWEVKYKAMLKLCESARQHP